MGKSLAWGALLVACSLSVSVSTAAEPRGIRTDEGRGWRTCNELHARVDVAGENHGRLYVGPGDHYARVGHLRAENGALVPVDVLMTTDGWLLVQGPAVDAALARGEPDGAHQEGSAWILGQGVTADVDQARAFAFPRDGSQTLIQSLDGRPLAAHGRLADIIACDQDWIFGRWELTEPARLRWLPETQVWSDPYRLEAWTPHRSAFPTREDVHRAIGDWLAESYGDEEMGRTLRVSRESGAIAVEYVASFWHGNGGPVFQVSARREGELCGGDEWRRDAWGSEGDAAAAARDVRARLAAALQSCGSSDDEAAMLLTGFERAFSLAAPWAEQDRLYVLAVGQAIASYGEETGHH